MRERITAAFIVLALAVLMGAGLVRAYTLRDLLREQEGVHLTQDVALLGEILQDRQEEGLPIDTEFLESVVPPQTRLTYADAEARRMTVTGDDYSGTPGDDLSASGEAGEGVVELGREQAAVGDIYRSDLGQLVTLFVLIAVLAGLAGWLAAMALSSPFQKLAVAAGSLGRGRFDLDLPRTRMPEARAIADSLRASALQLESRLARERAFAEHASHVLRTPLTALRLELEDLTLRDDVSADVKAAAARCMTGVDAVNASAGELVALARRGSLVEGAEVTLHDLATSLAQRWADRLADQRRALSASVEGDLDLTFTPGPVEQVLDLVLADVALAGRGPVRIVFHGEEQHLQVRVEAGALAAAGARRRGPDPGAGLAEARTLADSQGGRILGDGVERDLEILLPRR